jgi:hypothetical protein
MSIYGRKARKNRMLSAGSKEDRRLGCGDVSGVIERRPGKANRLKACRHFSFRDVFRGRKHLTGEGRRTIRFPQEIRLEPIRWIRPCFLSRQATPDGRMNPPGLSAGSFPRHSRRGRKQFPWSCVPDASHSDLAEPTVITGSALFAAQRQIFPLSAFN